MPGWNLILQYNWKIPEQGIKKLLVVSPAFLCDCLETLEEIHKEGYEILWKPVARSIPLYLVWTTEMSGYMRWPGLSIILWFLHNSIMAFLYIKALHIIFVVTWFAGLFYTVRLFIYNREARDKAEPEKRFFKTSLISWLNDCGTELPGHPAYLLYFLADGCCITMLNFRPGCG